MAQARRRSKKPKAGFGSNALGMFFSGMVVGAVATSFITGIRSSDPESIGRGIEHMISTSRNQVTAPQNITQSSPPQDFTTSFDFYEILPEIEQIVPLPIEDKKVSENSAKVANPSKPDVNSIVKPRNESKSDGKYLLQAGSFKKLSDADRLKAELALSGLVSKIQKVSIEGRGNFYRVRLGPYVSVEALGPINRQLEGMKIKALMLKVVSG
jgi:cell division protein FtsN